MWQPWAVNTYHQKCKQASVGYARVVEATDHHTKAAIQGFARAANALEGGSLGLCWKYIWFHASTETNIDPVQSYL